MPLDLATVPCLTDNYAYLIHDPDSGASAVVDVPDAAAVAAALEARGWTLTDILLTHHHADHVGGVADLRGQTGARVWGNAADADRLPALDEAVTPGSAVAICGEAARVIDVPGHTLGHIAYYFSTSGLLFSGDSLMAMGCGRLFEGTPSQMWDTLSTLAELPGDTQVCSGHEYTAANIHFALSVDAANPALADRADRVRAKRAANQPTLPSLLAEELLTNPFLRAGAADLKQVLGLADAADAEVFAHVRALKDAF